jgi:hypothetical protein
LNRSSCKDSLLTTPPKELSRSSFFSFSSSFRFPLSVGDSPFSRSSLNLTTRNGQGKRWKRRRHRLILGSLNFVKFFFFFFFSFQFSWNVDKHLCLRFNRGYCVLSLSLSLQPRSPQGRHPWLVHKLSSSEGKLLRSLSSSEGFGFFALWSPNTREGERRERKVRVRRKRR